MPRCIMLVLGLFTSILASAQGIVFSGVVTDRTTGNPVEFATVVLESTGLWAIADDKGCFEIKGVRPGKTVVTVSCLGYVADTKDITISKDIIYKVALSPDNLSLESVVVTAKENANSTTTSRVIDKTALDHIQIMNVTDISSLLPGGVTSNPSLIGEHNFTIRTGSVQEDGNVNFGAAVEVDGIRLSNNSSFSGADYTSMSLRGASTNNIASSNVESIEVISGVASVEYGDMTSGVVKINTQRGKTPFILTMSTTPCNKQLSLSKGFSLRTSSGRSSGIINANAEYTKSISEPMSPYTSYDRKQMSVNYSHTLARGVFSSCPLKLDIGVTGNIGGSNSMSDPDQYRDSYTKVSDNALRANLSFDLLLNRSWITNIEFKGSVSYSDRSSTQKAYYSSSSSISALHGTETGYLMSEAYKDSPGVQPIVQIAPGYWSNVMNSDDRPFYFKTSLKANWARNFGLVNNKVKIGGDLSGDRNLGRGKWTEDMATAPSFREYRFCDVPFMLNAAAYIEDNLTFPVGQGRINVVAGLRNDNTVIKGSLYGTSSSFSPRFSARYVILDPKGRSRKIMRSLSVRGGWGNSVKLPSFAVLFPQPSYHDVEVFRSTASAENVVSSAYYTIPQTIEYNPSLRWQSSRQSELGIDMNVAGVKIGLSAYYTETVDSYRLQSCYVPFTYRFTNTSAVQGSSIPVSDRVYGIDRVTGVVTISDRTGMLPSEQAAYIDRNQFVVGTQIDNDDTPIRRYGLEWTVDFPKINAINTNFRIDGNFYGYRSLYTDMVAYCPWSTVGADGSFYKYIGYFYGDNSQSNGTETKTIRNNVTIITHIPKVRLVITLKLESCLLKYSRALSERLDGKTRSYPLDDRSNILDFADRSIYDGNGYAVLFPDTYSSIDAPGVRKDFMSDLKWAKDNDADMYSDLSRLVQTTSYDYIFRKDYISPFFSANLSVTKEIGDMASISFYANNFFNNMGQVYSTKTGNYSSVSSYIPAFYYGLSIRLKF